jgi:hypothetical protein
MHCAVFFHRSSRSKGGGDIDVNTSPVTSAVGSMSTEPLVGAETHGARHTLHGNSSTLAVDKGGAGGVVHPSTATKKTPKKRMPKASPTASAFTPLVLHSTQQPLQMQHHQHNLQQYQVPAAATGRSPSNISRSYSTEAASGLLNMFNDRTATLGPPSSAAETSPSSQQRHGFATAANAEILDDASMLGYSLGHQLDFATNDAASESITSLARPMVAAGSMSIVAPTYNDMMRAGKFPEPSPAACGKRKMDEIAAAHMLAGVVSRATDAINSTSNGGELPSPNKRSNGSVTGTAAIASASTMPAEGANRQSSLSEYLAGVFEDEDTATPPPPPVEDFAPNSPFSAAAAAIAGRSMVGSGLALQIINPDTLGGHDSSLFRRHLLNGQASPRTPWDCQLEALVR